MQKAEASSSVAPDAAVTSAFPQPPSHVAPFFHRPLNPPSPSEIFYFIDDEVIDLEYSSDHLMRPVRLRLLHSLVKSLGLDQRMTICHSQNAEPQDLFPFHPTDYVAFLLNAKLVCTHQRDPCSGMLQYEYGAGAFSNGDCPLFPEVWRVVRSYCGASLACADALIAAHHRNGEGCKIAINWAGGMHHAAAHKASGFCYANDICLCIHRLLRVFYRVLYIDIDVHHGDGVEHAFADSRRVMTLSIHQFGNGFFPGTGAVSDVGVGEGTGFAVNVPVPSRAGDALYSAAFTTALHEVMRAFAPEAVVMQCGADSVFGDLIGGLCVSSRNHARCVEQVLGYGLPTVLLGGGGYNVAHTAMTWAVDTAAALGVIDALPAYIPSHDPYYVYYRQQQADALVLPRLLIDPPPGSMPPHHGSGSARGLRQLMMRLLPVVDAQMRTVRRWRISFPTAVASKPGDHRCIAALVEAVRKDREERCHRYGAGVSAEEVSADGTSGRSSGEEPLGTSLLRMFASERVEQRRSRHSRKAKRLRREEGVMEDEAKGSTVDFSLTPAPRRALSEAASATNHDGESARSRSATAVNRVASESPAGLTTSIGWLHAVHMHPSRRVPHEASV